MTWSIWEDGCWSYANTTPCYIKDFSLFGFWYRQGWGGGVCAVLDQPPSPQPNKKG